MNALGTSGTGGAVQSLDHEILGEKAATLGRAGDRVEKALKRSMPILSKGNCAACVVIRMSSESMEFPRKCWSGWARRNHLHTAATICPLRALILDNCPAGA